jgi:leucyl/phenylalanyl-tRNA--protein transferase
MVTSHGTSLRGVQMTVSAGRATTRLGVRGGQQPTEPPPTDVEFPATTERDEHGRVFVGGDLRPGTILAAYRRGLFPMRQGDGQLAWWSPDPRGVMRPQDLHVSRSLRQSCAHFDIRVNTAFAEVIGACAKREEGEYHWITDEVTAAYGQLHELGWVHSVEAWTRGDEPRLAGGLYGVAIGGVFAGESMFHRERDASKAAFVALIALLGAGSSPESRLIDAQWLTPHLASLGAVAVPANEYEASLAEALALDLPPALASAV